MEELKQILNRHRRNALKLAVFVVPPVALVWMAGLVWSDVSLYQQEVVITQSGTVNDATTGLSVDPLTRAIEPIFGDFQSKKSASSTNSSDIPVTNLKLELKAIFYSTDPKAGAALISKQWRKRAKLYYIGDSIMGGVRLEQVQTDNIVIERQGASESLKLPRLGKKS